MNTGLVLPQIWKEIRRSRSITICGGILVFVAVLAVMGPLMSPHSYLTTDFDGRLIAPTLSNFHIFGTDDLGRDLFVRTLWAGKLHCWSPSLPVLSVS